jgi:hypothetical protein
MEVRYQALLEAVLKNEIAFIRLSKIELTEIANHMSDPRLAEHMPLLTGVDDVTAPRRHRCAKVGLQ